MLVTSQSGFEDLLAGELAEAGRAPIERGPGWVWTGEPAPDGAAAQELPELVFAHLGLPGAVEVRGETVNALAQRLAGGFLESLRGVRVEGNWPCVFLFPASVVGLGRRVAAVEDAFHELVRKKLARIDRLAVPDVPRGLGLVTGWGVHFVDFKRAFAGSRIHRNGQRRMADDDLAPSRSYLKLEEAYGVLGCEPAPGETAVDLGAAPGGWSYSAAKRGARVVAVDNGPLKGGALDHPLIEHRRTDAFGFSPAAGERFDWLFCDLVEEPNHVMANVVSPWLANRWCRRFVVNLKFGRVDPLAFLRELRSPQGVLATHAPGFRVRHLFHDREEVTVVGETAP